MGVAGIGAGEAHSEQVKEDRSPGTTSASRKTPTESWLACWLAAILIV